MDSDRGQPASGDAMESSTPLSFVQQEPDMPDRPSSEAFPVCSTHVSLLSAPTPFSLSLLPPWTCAVPLRCCIETAAAPLTPHPVPTDATFSHPN